MPDRELTADERALITQWLIKHGVSPSTVSRDSLNILPGDTDLETQVRWMHVEERTFTVRDDDPPLYIRSGKRAQPAETHPDAPYRVDAET